MNIDSIYIPILLDFAIVLTLAICVLHGMRKGLILSLASFLVLALSMIGATMVSQAATEPLTDLIAPQVALAIEAQTLDSFPEMEDSDGSIFLDQVGETLTESDTLSSVMTFLGIDQAYLETFLETSSSTASAYRSTVFNSIANTITSAFVSVIIWLVVFIILMLVLTLIAHALDLAARLPVIHQLNAASGAVFGLIQGLILVFIVLVVAEFFGWLPEESILAETHLLALLRNPMPTLVSLSNSVNKGA